MTLTNFLPTSWRHRSMNLFTRRATRIQTSVEPTADSPIFPPPPPEELLSKSAYYNDLLDKRKFATPDGTSEDTPLFAVYRMYEALVLNRTRKLRNELEGFWFNRWPVSSIPGPEDHLEPARYAILACIPALIAYAFNERINLGLPRRAPAIMTMEEIEAYQLEEKVLEHAPDWTAQIKPLEKVLKIPHEEGETLETFEDERASPQLAQKNILCWQPHILFI